MDIPMTPDLLVLEGLAQFSHKLVVLLLVLVRVVLMLV
jgi:hypothetical protein